MAACPTFYLYIEYSKDRVMQKHTFSDKGKMVYIDAPCINAKQIWVQEVDALQAVAYFVLPTHALDVTHLL